MAESSNDLNRDDVGRQTCGGMPDGPIHRNEVVAILAEALLEILVPGTGNAVGSSRNPLITGSQPALLLTENEAPKRPSQRGRKRR